MCKGQNLSMLGGGVEWRAVKTARTAQACSSKPCQARTLACASGGGVGCHCADHTEPTRAVSLSRLAFVS